jgi:hypothetical protein
VSRDFGRGTSSWRPATCRLTNRLKDSRLPRRNMQQDERRALRPAPTSFPSLDELGADVQVPGENGLRSLQACADALDGVAVEWGWRTGECGRSQASLAPRVLERLVH